MSKKRVLAALLVLGAVPAVVLAQGLGDASKKEKKRRAQSTASAKTYTEADLDGLEPVANEGDAEPQPDSASRELSAPVIPRTSSREETGRRDEEQMWRSRVAQAEARIAEERAVYEHWTKQTLVPGYALVDENNRPVATSVEELQAITARAKARLEMAQKALADLREEARRAGVRPGWLR
jgi:hypothetical protein